MERRCAERSYHHLHAAVHTSRCTNMLCAALLLSKALHTALIVKKADHLGQKQAYRQGSRRPAHTHAIPCGKIRKPLVN